MAQLHCVGARITHGEHDEYPWRKKATESKEVRRWRREWKEAPVSCKKMLHTVSHGSTRSVDPPHIRVCAH